MNLMDNPWHFTLPQVSFVVVFAMVSGLYFFVVKGWLRWAWPQGCWQQ